MSGRAMDLATNLVRGVAAAGAGTLLGLRLVPPARGAVGPLDVSARLTIDPRGGATVRLPPAGVARAATHRGPLGLELTVDGIDLDRGKDLVGGAGSLDALRSQATTATRRLAVRAAVSGVAGALAATAAVAAGLRRPGDDRAVVTATTAGAGLLAAGCAVAAATRDPAAVRTPELRGLLERAPLLLGDVRQLPENLERYRDQLAELLATAGAVFDRVTDLPPPPPTDAIRLVHVSDIHLSPLALPLAAVLVERYHADAVIDTGDLVDWGTPAEQRTADAIGELGVPYLYVKGNHDSAGIAAAVARQPNATVLDASDPEPAVVAGLRFVGMADPRFTPDKTTGDDHAHHRVGEAARAFAADLDARGAQADIALVHAPAAARPLAGRVGIVLAGDIHRRDARTLAGGTTLLVQGTSGGAGLRGVQQDPPTPLSLSVLFVDRTSRRLWGVDEITLDGLGGTAVQLRRIRAADLLAERSPAS